MLQDYSIFSMQMCIFVTWHDDQVYIRYRTFNDFVRLILSFDYFSDFEASFIRLLDKLTNGSNIVVNETGKYRIQLSFLRFSTANEKNRLTLSNVIEQQIFMK